MSSADTYRGLTPLTHYQNTFYIYIAWCMPIMSESTDFNVYVPNAPELKYDIKID